MKNNNKPLVSICCMAYNQEKFISQCIEGFLLQKTNFVFEIIIHDDASTDKTGEIIKSYSNKYPNLFITIFQEENQYSRGGKITPRFIHPRVKGKYLALCEGDDYWTDPYKLQKQVDFLESNPDYGLVFTDYDRLIEKTGEFEKSHNKHINRKVPVGSIYNNLLLENTIATLTVMYRKEVLEKHAVSNYSLKNKKYKMGDYPRWLMISLDYEIGYLNESTATYRVLENSASHSLDIKKKYNFIMSEFDVKFDFIEAYGSDEKVKDRIEKEYFKKKIEYGFFMKDFMLIKDSYNELIKISKPRLKDRIMFLSTFSKMNWHIISALISIKNFKKTNKY